MIDENVAVKVGDTFMLIDEFNGPVGPVNIKKVTRAYIYADREGDEYTFHQDGWAIGYSGRFHLAVITSETEEKWEKRKLCKDILSTRAMEDLCAPVNLEEVSLAQLRRIKEKLDILLDEITDMQMAQDVADKIALDKEEDL